MLRVAVLSLVCSIGTTSLRDQGAAAAGAAGTKIGVISMLQAISLTAEGKQAAVELQLQFASRQQELESLDKQISDYSRC
jgi:Skp family chaperone for outer membrane proteins